MDIDKIASSLHPLERKVLPALRETSSFEDLAKKTGLQKVEVMRALQWLQNKKIIAISQQLREEIDLDENGLKYKSKGLPEKTFLEYVSKHEPVDLDQIHANTGLSKEELSICLGILKSKQIIEVIKADKIKIAINKRLNLETNILNLISAEEAFLNKSFPTTASELNEGEKKILDEFKKRKRIVKAHIIKAINAKLTELGKKIVEHGVSGKGIMDRLTPESIKSGAWKGKKLRRYDVTINVPNISGGRLHFVTQATRYIKRIWLDMGFKEMQGTLIQTSFWDLDSLFVPQDHPAREMQDTFYIKEPKYGKLPAELVKKVKAAHENGFTTGSKGWRYKWSEDAAKENLMRTHNTVLSARTIASLKKENLPAKFFSVGKVFRNETLSWKSLFEFTQVEGIVVDPNANFKHLKGYLKEFFAKMGFPDVRIRPAHFPYTEPSAEVDVWHPGKKKWIELGGSGIFRPEVVKPLLGQDVPVLAWGLGMERSIMDYYSFTDVRDIYKNDLKQIREIKIWMK